MFQRIYFPKYTCVRVYHKFSSTNTLTHSYLVDIASIHWRYTVGGTPVSNIYSIHETFISLTYLYTRRFLPFCFSLLFPSFSYKLPTASRRFSINGASATTNIQGLDVELVCEMESEGPKDRKTKIKAQRKLRIGKLNRRNWLQTVS